MASDVRACASFKYTGNVNEVRNHKKVTWDEEHSIALSKLIHDLALPATWLYRTGTFHLGKSVETGEGLTRYTQALSVSSSILGVTLGCRSENAAWSPTE